MYTNSKSRKKILGSPSSMQIIKWTRNPRGMTLSEDSYFSFLMIYWPNILKNLTKEIRRNVSICFKVIIKQVQNKWMTIQLKSAS